MNNNTLSKGGITVMTAQQAVDGVKDVAIFISATFSAWFLFIRLPRWISKKIRERRERKDYIAATLKSLCKGVNELYYKLEGMDEARSKARKDDADVRANLYLSQIAMIGAIRELAKHMGIEINGEVKRYYEMNVDNLRRGVGMEPLHATETKAERNEAAHIVIDESMLKGKEE